MSWVKESTEIKRIKQYLLGLAYKERSQFILWLPVLFGIGIALYFSLPSEPKMQSPIALSAMLGSLLLLGRRHKMVLYSLLVLVMISGGFAVAMLRAHQVQAPVIADEWKKVYRIKATLEKVEEQDRGVRVWFNHVTLHNADPMWTPERIRLNVNTKLRDVRAGDVVSLNAVLYPPPLPAMPGAYDFARQAYFERIGAVGYAVSDVTLVERAERWSFANWLAELRHQTAQSLRNASRNENEGAIASALLVGERGAIKQSLVEDMRDAGLAHLLAISGLHLALVATIFFFMVRLLLALSQRLALHHPIKQYAAGAAIICSFFYLMITGSPISAERAFIMTGLVLFAIMLNRSVTPLRSITFAALIVLIFTPESILSPSFQMSFSAAGALIAAFEFLRKPMANLLYEAGWFRRLTVYVLGVLLSSLVAGMATAPFALYHFSHMSSYSLLANLVAVPLTSMWIMPWGVMAFMLMPFGLEAVALYPMGVGIDIVISVATYVASLPNANPAVQALPIESLVLITLALLWLALWKSKLRIYGVALLIPAIWIAFLTPVPDILVNEDGRMLAFRNNQAMYEFPAKTTPGFVKESWLERMGQNDYITLKANQSSANLTVEGDRNYLYHKDGQTILFAHDKAYAALRCAEADYFVDVYWYEAMACEGVPTLFNRQDLDLNGTHVVYLKEGASPRVEHVRGYRGERKW